MNKYQFAVTIVLMLSCGSGWSQSATLPISAVTDYEVFNRQITVVQNEGIPQAHLDARPGNGVAWIKHSGFATGTIELDVKGRDVLQQSFVGIAFHGTNDSTYDAIYFRPFNFNSPDTARKHHSVQYICMPDYDWQILRTKFPGTYENALTVTVQANAWFHAKIIVHADKIQVFVNNSADPSLTVKPLHAYAAGKVGFWVGNNSEGDFSNLIIKK